MQCAHCSVGTVHEIKAQMQLVMFVLFTSQLVNANDVLPMFVVFFCNIYFLFSNCTFITKPTLWLVRKGEGWEGSAKS